MDEIEFFQQRESFGGKRHLHATSVLRAGTAFHELQGFHPIDQSDRAVMRNSHLLREFSHGHPAAARKPFDRQESLVLLRSDAVSRGSLFAEAEKLPERIPEFSEGFVVGFCKRFVLRGHAPNGVTATFMTRAKHFGFSKNRRAPL